MKVKLIDDNWDLENSPQWFKNVMTVGDPIPVLNGEYTVKGFLYDYDNSKRVAYQLEEFDYSIYDTIGLFNIDKFEIIDDSYVPNCVIDIGEYSFVGERINMYVSINEEDLKYLLPSYKEVKRI